jgi:NifB/MoaA-like Fe-S oxidoreductase
MFLLAGKSIPSHKYYGEFPQIENGVGMVRRFLTDFNRRKRFFPSSIEPERKMILVTGISMAPFLKEKILPVLQQSAGLKAELLVVENHYLGNTVTVAGLLAGQDILEALKGHPADLIVLPPDCVNQDGVFLDDISLVEFQEKVLAKVMVYNYTFNDILRRL